MNRMRLLIAEDDVALGGFLRRGLESEGYGVQVVGDGHAALESLCADAPDLAILDLGLPGCDGTEVLRRVRESGSTFPVLVLTGQNELETRLRCLDMGADECMFKPFSLQELRARCRVLLRRAARPADQVVQVADLVMRRMERVVERGGRRISLTNREYALLEQLLLERGRCVSRDVLLQRVWGLNSCETNVIDVYINYLRSKLGDRGSQHLIETVRGRGYRISPPSRLAAEQVAGHTPVPEDRHSDCAMNCA
ncbi:MAG TPA: response regulator transcription factor [Acidobacteriaceae bacterium]